MKKISMNSKKDRTFGECVDEFLHKCKIKNLTKNSIKSYQTKLNVISHFIPSDLDVKEINEEMIDDLIIWLETEHSDNPATINTYLRAIRAVLNFCYDRNWTGKIKVQLLKQEDKLKDIYTDNELKLLLKKPNKNNCTFVEFRTWTLENYLLGTGNRISTALEIKIQDVDFDNELIRLTRTKNRKQQIIPLSHTLISILQEYVDVRGGEPDDYLFCNEYGGHCCLSTIQQTVARYNIKRGVTKTSCHLFRHSFATRYLRNGGDIYRLQKLLGHSSVKVTEKYLHMIPEDLRTDYNKINPLETLISNKKQIKLRK